MLRITDNIYITLILSLIFFPGKFLTAQSPYSQKYQFGKTTALVNATVYIDYKTRVDSATLICKDGKIVSVERKGIPPGEAEVLDYSGKVIYPSFVELISDYGVGNILSTPGGKPHYETTTKGAYSYNQAIKPEIEAERYFKHDPTKARILREQGFGTVISANGDGIVRGTSSAVLLTDLPEHESIIRSSASLNFSFNKGSSTQEYPSSLMGAIALVRQTLYDVDAYQKNKGKIPYDISMEKLSLYKTLPWIFETANAANILRAQKIANEFGAKVLMHASSDEYKHLQEIKKSNVFLIVSLNFPEAFKITSPKDAELISNTQLMEWYFAPFNIHYLSKENLDFAISASNLKDPKDFSKNLKKILETNVDAALVLKSLTYNPCVQLKIYDKVGSLHVGKLANFLVCNQTIDAKEFTIQENWVKGEKYIINQIHKNISGIYKLKIGSYPDMKLEVNTALEKPKATVSLLKDTSNIPAVIEQQNDQITVVFSPNKIDSSAKQKIYLRAYQYSEEYIKGNASSLAWTNDEVFSAHKIDSIKTLKKELSKIKLRVPSLALPYPFSAFVRDSIYRKQNCILKNAIIWTGEESFELEGYSLVLRDGIIAAIERDPDPRKYFGKQPYEVVDADSKYITAGIIDEHSHIAINGGVNETGKSVTSEVRIQDVINSQDINIYRQLAGGVTTAHLLHGSANCIGGQSVLINLKWGLSPEELKFHDNVPFIKFALGENVKQSNWGDRYVIRYPQSRMGVEQTIMDAFQRAQEYKKAQQQAQHSRSQTQIVTKKDLELEAILEILEKKRFITCHSYSQSEINMLMKVAESFNFKVNTFTHVLEGYKISDKLRKHGAGASSFSDWWSFKAEVRDAIPHNAALLSNAGLVTAINSDDPEMGTRLNQEAAKSVKYGNLSEAEAWRLVTLNPARLLRVDDKIGSIKIGKLANVVIWSANPLSVYAKAERVYIEGTKYYDIDEDEKLANKNRNVRKQILEEMLNDKTPEDKKAVPVPEKQEHYHCDSFETIE